MVYKLSESIRRCQQKQEDFFRSEVLRKKYSATLTTDDAKILGSGLCEAVFFAKTLIDTVLITHIGSVNFT
jgi:hypothetical protein